MGPLQLESKDDGSGAYHRASGTHQSDGAWLRTCAKKSIARTRGFMWVEATETRPEPSKKARFNLAHTLGPEMQSTCNATREADDEALLMHRRRLLLFRVGGRLRKRCVSR